MLTLVEYVLRRELKSLGGVLARLLPGNSKREIDNSTTERLLKVFGGVTLTVVRIQGQELWYVTPPSGVQMKILDLHGLAPAVYLGLAENPG